MLVVSVVAALAAAFMNAVAAYLEQSSAKRLPGSGGVSARQLAALLERPRWLAGQASDIVAFLLQALALSFGALIFVEPILVLALPFAVLLRAMGTRQRPERRAWGGTAACVVGLGAFLATARPTSQGSPSLTLAEALPLAIGLAVALAGFLIGAKVTSNNRRAVFFTLAGGTAYGVTAGLVKVITSQLQEDGLLAPLSHWTLYAMVAVALAGVFLMQSALKIGALAAPVAVLMVVDPLASIAIGIVWLGERISDSPAAIGIEGVTLALMIVGIVELAQQSVRMSAPIDS